MSKESKLTEFFSRLKKSPILNSSIFLALVSALFAAIIGVRTGLSNDFNQLSDNVQALAGIHDTLYNFCVHSINKSKPPYSDYQKTRLSQIDDQLRKKLDKLNRSHSHLGKYVNEKTYLAVHEMACWTNNLLKDGDNICTKANKNGKRMNHWRDRIIHEIKLNKDHHLKFSSAITDFMREYTSDPRDKKYKYAACDLTKIDAY